MGLVSISPHQRPLKIYNLSLYGFWSIFHSHMFLHTPQMVQSKQGMILFGVFLVLTKTLTISTASGAHQTFGEGGLVWRWFCLKQDMSRSHILFSTHTQFPLNLKQLEQTIKGTEVAENSHPTLQNHFPLLPLVFTVYHQRHVPCNT